MLNPVTDFWALAHFFFFLVVCLDAANFADAPSRISRHPRATYAQHSVTDDCIEMKQMLRDNEATNKSLDSDLQPGQPDREDFTTVEARQVKELTVTLQKEAGPESGTCGRLKRLADAISEELADADRDVNAAAERTGELEAENRRLRAELSASRAFAADQTAKAEELARLNALIRLENAAESTQHAEEMATLRAELESMKKSRDEASAKVREVEEAESASSAQHARELGAWKSAFESTKQMQEAYAIKLKKMETDLALESRLNAYFLASRHDESLLHWKLDVRDWLAVIISDFWTAGELHVVGSSVNGCGSCDSDLDLTLLIAGADGRIHEDRDFAIYVLDVLRNFLIANAYCENVQFIDAAKVPILRLTSLTETGPLQVDISVNNFFAVYNSRFLKAYARLDQRFPLMSVVVRRWAKQNGIADASKGTFNSYTLNLMILHFLLHATDPPVFHGFRTLSGREHQLNMPAFVRDFQPQLLKGSLTNDTTVARLLKGFFNYYANFDFATHAVSFATRDPFRSALFASSLIVVEDPLEPNVNCARTVWDASKRAVIVSAFQTTRTAVNSGRLSKILDILHV